MEIRDERPDDAVTLRDLTYRAFKPMSFSDDSEADALDQLRADGDLMLSLVAEQDSKIVGHVAFSPVSFTDGSTGFAGLGPISVEPDLQRRGIGRALIDAGFARLKQLGMRGCVLIGNPDVYASSGFVSSGQLSYQDLPSQYVQHIVFEGATPQGEVTFAPGLEATSAG